ncbi:MAG: ABC transporter permease subunit, partial [Acidimicrobiia bacterium]|nr:ABC transporter permease subunit [Acidimicrobiia bacterium]
VLDRIWRSLAQSERTKRVDRRVLGWTALGLVGATVMGVVFGWVEFPSVWTPALFDPVDQAVTWARDNLSFLSRPFSDFVVSSIYIPARDFLTDGAAWPVLVFVAAWIGWMLKGWRLALFAVTGIVAIGLVGMWELSIDTFVQVIIASVLAVAVAVPLGVWAGRRPRVEAFFGPILDALQTVPSLVYIIPAVILFTVGVVPGIIATVLYAIVPGIRITALGVRQVPIETVEASRTFGATPRQTMYGVRLPLAAPTIMAGINQVIMMVLAMVIITGLVGAGALGFETVRSLQRSLFGLGFEVGLALVVIAMILDRFTEAAAERLQPPGGH